MDKHNTLNNTLSHLWFHKFPGKASPAGTACACKFAYSMQSWHNMKLPVSLIWYCWHIALLLTGVSVFVWTVLMHKPAAAGGMWRGSPAWRNDLPHEWLVISCWEDRIWHLFNLGKVGVSAYFLCVSVCVCVGACMCECVQAALHNTLTAPSGSYPYACFGLVIPSEWL